MKISNKIRFISLLLIILLVVTMTVSLTSMAAEPTVELGTTSSFAIFASSTITNTGTTTIIGDVGLHPGTSFTGQAGVTLSGAMHLADAFAYIAKVDLITAYNDAAGRTPTIIPTELGGTTLYPGIYASADGTFNITGTLTLDAQGDPNGAFIFQTAATLITSTDSSVVLINEAETCQTYWKVGSSATLGTNSNFVGNILAMESITANTGAVVQGKLLARTGAVTLDTNTITTEICTTTPDPTPLINIIKTPNPLALTGEGSVTYTYEVTNPGAVALSEVSVTDDKISSVNYVSGDVNDDNLLQTNETWIYTSIMNLTETTTNIAIAEGSASGIIATDSTFATVIVTPVVVPPIVVPPAAPVYPPLINVIKTPEPLALTTGQGLVTYTYKVTNPGMVALSSVSVTDDKISSVNYVSGDVNADNMLQINETWIYTSNMNIIKTTTNTATAKGSANGITAIDTAFATVVVTPVPVSPPLINVIKLPNPLALTTGQGLVTYTYKVTNPGKVALSNVSVTDDKISSVKYVSGDVNGDNLLQINETWIYTGNMNLTSTTTNTATAKGSANGMIAVDFAFATVVVTPPSGQLPNTATPWYNALLAGAVIMLIGAVGFISRKRLK